MLAYDAILPFADAIAYAKARDVVLPDKFYSKKYTDVLRQNAFTITDMARLDQIKSVFDYLNKEVLEKGGTFYDFKKQAAQMKWDLPRYRLETIMRNHMQNAYQAGHWERFRANKERRPFLMYDAVNDSRTRPSHRALDGVIKPVDDPFWASHSPPLGHNCRCTLRSLTKEVAKRRGGPTQNVKKGAGPDPGWGTHPLDGREGTVQSQWSRKVETMPPPLQQSARRRDSRKQIERDKG